jgi:hypothetical protein
MRRAGLVLGLGLGMLSCGTRAAAPEHVSPVPEGFWDHWGDGRAEISGYALVQPRYGSLRRGEAVLVFVTEDFTRATRVKSDGGHGDEYPVLKLNDVRTFQTGIYDYRTMTSAFVALDGSHPPGIAHDQIVVSGEQYERTLHSYFDGEADRVERERIPAGGVFEDSLPVYVRGLAGTLAPPGKEVAIRLLPSRLHDRIAHVDPIWRDATLQRGNPYDVTVPAGTFAVVDWTLSVGDRSAVWAVEEAAPHRIIRWSTSEGERAVLTGSVREPYWEQAGVRFEARREALGLPAHRWPADETATPDL